MAGQCRNPALLFSGGKDSLVLLRLAEKAFRPGRFPFPLLHIDTGHNFPEVIAFRDSRAAELGERLIVRSVEDSMASGRVVLKTPDESRNVHQSVTLLDAIAEFEFDACIGGARRDEEKARAKERVFSFRDAFGQWDPKNQRPELWNLYNARVHKGEHVRVFPISNWTELDVWQYIEREGLGVPSIYYAHTRPIVRRRGSLVPVTELTPPRAGEVVEQVSVRFRTVGDITCTAPVASTAATAQAIIIETAAATITERGATRLGRPDQRRVDGIAQEGGVFLMTSAGRSQRASAPRWGQRRDDIASAGVPIMSARDDPNVLDHGVLRFLTRGQRRRWQEHADRPSPLRHEGDPCRPAGRSHADVRAARADARPFSADRRAYGGARARNHDRRRVPLLRDRVAQVHHRRRAGHEQYTRNMVTAASTAHLAVLLVDARHGIVTQTRRHATLAHLLGIPHLVVARQQDGPRRLPRGRLRAHRCRLPRVRATHRHR